MNLGDKRMAVSGWRLGRCRAKVQIGAALLCKGAKVWRQGVGSGPRHDIGVLGSVE